MPSKLFIVFLQNIIMQIKYIVPNSCISIIIWHENIETLWIIVMHYDYSKINNNVVIETNQLHGLPIKMYIEYSAH